MNKKKSKDLVMRSCSTDFTHGINSIISKVEREDACYKDAHQSKNEVPCLILKGSFMPEKNKSVLKEIHILGREKESRRR